MRIATVALACGLLCGCMSGPAHELHDELMGYVGQNVREVIDRIGYPTSQQQILGDTVYTWSTNPGAVAIGGAAFSLYCTVQIGITPDGIIKTIHGAGNNGGCARWAGALAQ
jgi:hypothetical protein